MARKGMSGGKAANIQTPYLPGSQPGAVRQPPAVRHPNPHEGTFHQAVNLPGAAPTRIRGASGC